MSSLVLLRPQTYAESLSSGFSRFASEFEEIRPLFRVSSLDVLYDCYREPGRAYHGEEHILMLLGMFRRLRELAVDPLAVKTAIFFHDAVYHIPLDPQFPPPHDNEERSVKLMQMLALNPLHPSLAKAALLIRATAGHAGGRDIDLRLINDLDLSVLASSRARFARFERQIREEYAVYPLPLYCTARMTQLRSFMERRRIFSLTPLGWAWEEKARANLAWALEVLARGRLPGEG